uniref:NAC domain-containing protein n=1 Tax=Leersia perrieri TaxID=77586 RepID=A0A0D9V3W4_9ORYZ
MAAASSRPRRRCRAPRRREDNEIDEHPSEQDLLESYLLPHVASSTVRDKKSPPSFIHEADVYTADPAELTRRHAPAVAKKSGGAEAWYFLGPVRGLKGGGQRKARTVDDGAGCWHSEAGAKPVLASSGRCLGHLQSFSFLTKDDDGRRVRSGWLMVELSLDDNNEVVLSKVYFSPRAHLTTKNHVTAKKRKNLATTASPPPRHRRRRAPSPPEEEEEKKTLPETAPEAEECGGDEQPSWLEMRVALGFDTTPIDDETRVRDSPWLKDILMPFPVAPSTPPPRSPSPRREPIEMPEIREFFMRGPYLGEPDPPLYQFDPEKLAAAEKQLQLDGDQRGGGVDDRILLELAAQLEFERYFDLVRSRR